MNEALAIATISWARNKAEEELLYTSLQTLAMIGLPVFVTDGGSPEEFVARLQALPRVQVFLAKGLWAQARKSIQKAVDSGAETIFYTEPDKLELFRSKLPAVIHSFNPGANTGVVLLARSATAFGTFADFQQMTERTINNCCKEVTGIETDYCYGPFFFRASLFPQLSALPDDFGWGWRPFLFAMAHRRGFDTTAVVGDFACPEEQRADDARERLYRMKQLTQNIEGLLLATKQEKG